VLFLAITALLAAKFVFMSGVQDHANKTVFRASAAISGRLIIYFFAVFSYTLLDFREKGIA